MHIKLFHGTKMAPSEHSTYVVQSCIGTFHDMFNASVSDRQ